MPYIAREEDYLAHHGVKGMHWGVRKDRSTGGGIRGRKKAQEQIRTQAVKKYSDEVSKVWSDCDKGKKSYLQGYNELYSSLQKITDKKTKKMAKKVFMRFSSDNAERR